MIAEKRITAVCLQEMRQAIAEADGAEVLFCASVNDDGMIFAAGVAARGSLTQVPALFPHMAKGDVVIHNHPGGGLQPSPADLGIASELGNQGIGFYIANNEVTRLYCVAEPVKRPQIKPLNIDKAAAVLEAGGALSQSIEGYEPRQSQIELLRFIAETFNGNFIAIAEGGTGVGKSFAYLIPALMWAKQNGERIVISTATIALQEQLMQKDVPAVKRLLKARVKAVLAKGRQNYVCRRRLKEAWEEESLFLKEEDELAQIGRWAEETRTGDKAELGFLPKEEIWQRVASESDTCLGIRCPHHEQCFVFIARKEAASAQLIITNHHLLFADLNLRSKADREGMAILPPFSKIIFDEAHNIEAAASGFFSESLTFYSVNRQLARFYRRRAGKEAGLLPQLQEALGPVGEARINQAFTLLDKAKTANEQLHKQSGLCLPDSFRLSGAASEELKEGLLEPIAELEKTLAALHEGADALLALLDDEAAGAALALEARAVCSRLGGLAALCGRFLRYRDEEETVFWGERRKNSSGEHFCRFIATPLDIGAKMRENLYEKHESVVMVSATLAVRNDFSFFQKRVGLYGYQGRLTQCAIFPSPFPYASSALLLLPTDAPPPEQEEPYSSFTAAFLKRLFFVSGGRGLALFTSYKSLRLAADEIAPVLSAAGILTLRQGDEARSRLLERFTAHGRAVLFATDSFWEGVDIDNRALKAVALCRLPFAPPDAPLAQARAEQIAAAGGRPFFELQLPEAAIKLKQGFGRLMRKSRDFGAVAILDPRLLTKGYGRQLLAALPPAKRLALSSSEALERLQDFLFQREGAPLKVQ